MLPVSATQGPLSSLQLGFAGLTKYLAKVKGVGPVCFSIIVFGDGPEDFGNGAVGYQTGLKSASLRHLGRGNCHASSAPARGLRSINKSWLGLLSAFDPLRTLAPYGRLHARLKFINASAWPRCVRSSVAGKGPIYDVAEEGIAAF